MTARTGQPPDLALELCRRIGANPSGPVGARLIESFNALPGLPPDGPEREVLIARLIDGATNRETYFFRDRRQLSALVGMLRTPGFAAAVALSLWSAGCATGEEAYSLAILLREAGLTGTVAGTDISRAALASARAAVYRTGPMSPCRDLTEADAAFLPSTADGRRTVAPAIRAMVRLAEHNILSGAPPPGIFDAVVCRNVLIYMDQDGRSAALAMLASAVRPGGLLLLGPGDVAPPVEPASHGFRPLFRDGATLFVKGGLG